MSKEDVFPIPILSDNMGKRISSEISSLSAGGADAVVETACIIAHGSSSMNPTLGELDLLEVVPYGNRHVSLGDVILFLSPEGAQPFVHRVVDILPEGIRTCGDNAIHKDPWLLKSDDIIGQVTGACRGRNRRKILGGRIGRIKGVLARMGNVWQPYVAFALHPLYRWMIRCGIVHRWIPSFLKPRVVRFQSNGFQQPLLLLGGRCIGRYNFQKCKWDIRRPFRLLVDEMSLPVR